VKKSITSRLRTFNEVSWAVSSWLMEKVAGPGQRTPDLSAVIQEIVDRPCWESGNGLVLIVMGSGYRQAYVYDGDWQKAPLLYAEYV
jgi:hypothetical protein